MLHQIHTSQIDNDDVCQGLKIIFGDDNIHSSPHMPGEKGEKSLSIHELHSPTRQLVMEIPSDGNTQYVPQYIKSSMWLFLPFFKVT